MVVQRSRPSSPVSGRTRSRMVADCVDVPLLSTGTMTTVPGALPVTPARQEPLLSRSNAAAATLHDFDAENDVESDEEQPLQRRQARSTRTTRTVRDKEPVRPSGQVLIDGDVLNQVLEQLGKLTARVEQQDQLLSRRDQRDFRPIQPEDSVSDDDQQVDRIQDDMSAILSRVGISRNRQERRQLADHAENRPEPRKSSSSMDKDILKGLLSTIPQYSGDGGPRAYFTFIMKVETFFEHADLDDKKQLAVVGNLLTGQASSFWLNAMRRASVDPRERIVNWSQLKSALQSRFLPADHELSTKKKMLSCVQSGTVDAYIRTFNDLRSQILEQDPESTQIMMFLNGLKPAVRELVNTNVQNLSTLMDLQSAARRLDSKPSQPQNRRSGPTSHGESANTSTDYQQRRPCNFCGIPSHFERECRRKARIIGEGKNPEEYSHRNNGNNHGNNHGNHRGRGNNHGHRGNRGGYRGRGRGRCAGNVGGAPAPNNPVPHDANQANHEEEPAAFSMDVVDDDNSPLPTDDTNAVTIDDEESAYRAEIERKDMRILIDSGASKHMVPHKAWFDADRLDYSRRPMVQSATDHRTSCQGIGDVPLNGLSLRDALYVPGLNKALLSVVAAIKANLYVEFSPEDHGICRIRRSKEGKIIATGHMHGDGFYLDDDHLPEKFDTVSNNFRRNFHGAHVTTVAESPVDLWHERFAHIGYANLRRAAEKVSGMPAISTLNRPETLCTGCMLGKATRAPLPQHSDTEYSLLELIHSDSTGPIGLSLGNNRHVTTFTDHFSRFAKEYFTPALGGTILLQQFKDYRAYAENLTGKSIKIFRCDRGSDFTSKVFTEYLRTNGITMQFSIRDTPSQNGIAERYHRTIEERVRAILHHRQLPLRLWAEVWRAVVRIYNTSPHSAIDSDLPIMRFHGLSTPPDVSHYRIIGCITYSHVLKEERTHKFGPTAETLIMIGYSATSKGWRLWNPITDAVVERRDVRFDESKFYSPETFGIMDPIIDPDTPIDTDTDIEYEVERIVRHAEIDGQLHYYIKWKGFPAAENTWEPRENLLGAMKMLAAYDDYAGIPINHGIAAAITDSDHTLPHFSSVSPSESAFTTQFTPHSTLAPNFPPEPRTWTEAISSPEADHWRAAAAAEIASLNANNTWIPRKLSDLPAHANLVDGKWVFKRKLNPDGTINKYKARFVARGFTQRFGIDYDATFAPVVSHTALRLLVAIASIFGWSLKQADVVTAYLNSLLKHRVFMRLPDGFADQFRIGTDGTDVAIVVELLKSLYGLKQSAYEWNDTFNTAAAQEGWIRCPVEPCLYLRYRRRGVENDSIATVPQSDAVQPDPIGIPYGKAIDFDALDRLLKSTMRFDDVVERIIHPTTDLVLERAMIVYVDDVVWIADTDTTANDTETMLNRHFKLEPASNLHHILGIRVSRPSLHEIYMDQTHYTERVLQRFGFSDANPAPTPLDSNAKLEKRADTASAAEINHYQQAVGAILYLSTCTRPDLSTAISIIASFMSNPAPQHWAGVKRIFRYLRGTSTLGLRYHSSGTMEIGDSITAYSDSDWAGDSSRYSRTGFIIMMASAAIAWRSVLQSIIASSSTEAELIAAAAADCDLRWIRSILMYFSLEKLRPTRLYMDNSGALTICQQNAINRRSRHVEIKVGLVKDSVKNGTIRVERVPTAENTADLFTKLLPAPRFKECVAEMGLCVVPTVADR